ncbi:MAG: ROK family protein [Erysipelotrichaceae bacterium]|nr:ROK family protein [Erysipelotrichaceae bacterium]
MFLVFDVGGTFTKYGLIDIRGNILEKSKFPTENKNGLEPFVDSLVKIYEQYKDKKIEGIALSVPGAVDVEKGIVYNGGGVPFLHEVCIKEVLSKRCDGINVSVENDGKSAALSEVWLGNAKNVNDAVVYVFGSGIGGAIVKDRKIHRGNRLIAGEVSNLITHYTKEDLQNKTSPIPGLWVYDGSAYIMCLKVARQKGLDDNSVTGEQVFKWASEGDKICLNVLDNMYFEIAKQIYNTQYFFDPDIVLIGGGISEQPVFIEGIKKYIDEFSKLEHQFAKPVVDVCKFNNDSNLLGALYNHLCLNHLINE